MCGRSDSYCVADLIPITGPDFENLRNIHKTELVEQVPINFAFDFEKSYPIHFQGSSFASFRNALTNLAEFIQTLSHFRQAQHTDH